MRAFPQVIPPYRTVSIRVGFENGTVKTVPYRF